MANEHGQLQRRTDLLNGNNLFSFIVHSLVDYTKAAGTKLLKDRILCGRVVAGDRAWIPRALLTQP